jgi:hypothetical protein
MLDSAPALGDVDAVSWHPYVGDVTQVLASVGRARSVLDGYGLTATPIEVTEVGLGAGYTPAQRGQWIHDLAMKLPNAGLGVSRMLPYVWTGDPTWQLTDPDGSPGVGGGSYFSGILDAASWQPPVAAAPVAKNTPAKSAAKKKAAKKTCTTTKARKTKAGKTIKAKKTCVTKVSKTVAKARAKKARAAKARAAARARARAAAKRA